MKTIQIMAISLATILFLSACGASQNEADKIQSTLDALSMQVTIEAGIEQTIEASSAGANSSDAGNDDSTPSANDTALGDPITPTICNPYPTLNDFENAVIQSLSNRNFQPLVQNKLLDEQVSIGYWQSEGRGLNAAEMEQELALNLLPIATHGIPFTITSDLSQFPPTQGGPEWISMFGSDSVAVLYSSGWGDDGIGEAMLYFSENECGGYVWKHTMYASFGFAPVALGPPPVAQNCSAYFSILDFETALIDTLQSRNFNQLIIDGMLSDPFNIGYYLSEGQERTPLEMEQDLINNFLPASNVTGFYATDDISSFPPDGGYPWFDYLGPDTIATIYSTGWGDDGTAEAFLYLKEDSCGNIIWYGMIYSWFGFP